MGIYIYIYIYIPESVTLLRMSRFCACAAHAQDNNNNNYLYVQWVAMVFLVYIFPAKVWHAAAFSCKGSARGICADAYIRISADASRRLQLKAAACQTFEVYQENYGDPLQVQVIIIIILRMRRSVTDIYIYIYIYIYIHLESLVRNHEPCAKALGNYW